MKNLISTILFLLIGIASYAQTLVPSNNANGVSSDMQFKLTFSSKPTIQRSGKISLYRSNGSLVETIDLSKMPAGVPMSSSWPWIESLNGTDIRVIPVTVDGNAVYIRFSDGVMGYNTSYYVTIDQAVISNVGFNGIGAGNWNFTTRSQPAADLNYVVSADGTGDFATLQGALNFLPTGNSNAHILVKNGTYVGLAFMKNKGGYTIEGESREGVWFKGYNNSNLNASTHWRSVLNLSGDNINLLSVSMINTTPNGGTQAEVLKLDGNQCVIANCEFYSYQDTVLIEGKVYFIDCMLEGDVDFIWGRGTVFFQSCELRANDNGGYNVMARNDNTKHGYCFADCKMTRTSSSTTTQYLGRDANTGYPYAEIVYLNCTMGPQIPSVGWQIRNEMNASTLVFAEYQSVNEQGNLINTSGRHAKSRQLSQSQATQYRDLNWYFNGWTPVVPNYSTATFDCNGDKDGTATRDECGVCVGGNTGKVSDCIATIEGEDFCEAQGIDEASNDGYMGAGYVNFDNTLGSSANWNVYAENAQSTTIGIRYANGGATARAMTVKVNGTTQTTFTGAPTGSWNTWKTENITLQLSSGSNQIVLTATSADGGPNIDLFAISELGLRDAGCEKDCNGVVGGGAFLDNCNTCVSGNTGKEACTKDCSGEWGGSAQADNCGVCLVDNSILPCTASIEGETACILDGTIDNNNAGFSGDGFANTNNVLGSQAGWILNSTQAQTATIGFRFANGGTTSRDGAITINGTAAGNLVLAPTGAWDTWLTTSVNLNLVDGANEIVVTANTADGLANIDVISFSAGVSDARCGTITTLSEAQGLSLNVHPNPTKGGVSWARVSQWQLSNLLGARLTQGEGQSIDLSAYPVGVYIIKFGDGSMVKVIKE